MRILFITDLFDPKLGSEFQVASKFMQYLENAQDCDVTLLTLRREKNLKNISTWMKLHGIQRINVELIPMLFSNTEGHHKSRLLFFLDLIRFYLKCFFRQRDYDAVWKCGQVNFIFNILFLLCPNLKILGPLSGFEYPPIKEIYKDGDIVLFIRYMFYSAIIFIALQIFKLAFILKKNLRYIIFATKKDLESFPSINKDRGFVISEIDISFLLSEIKAKSSIKKSIISKKRLKLLWVGSLVRRKRPIKAAELMMFLAQRNENISCTMLGDGPLSEKVIKKGFGLKPDTSLASEVTREEVFNLVQESDLILITSWREVNSVFLFEVLASNVSILAPNISGMCDTIFEENLFELSQLNDLVYMENIVLDELANDNKADNRQTLKNMMIEEEKNISKILKFLTSL